MKKFLLSIMAIVLSAGAVNAQSFFPTNPRKANLQKSLRAISKTPTTNKGIKKLKENETYYGYSGANNPVYMDGFPGYDVIAFGALYDNPQIGTDLEDMKIVGLAFLVSASLGENASCFVLSQDGEDVHSTYQDLNDQNYVVSVIHDDMITPKSNEVYFDKPIEITKNTTAIQWGIFYDQKTDKQSQDSYPILLGEVTTTNNGDSYMAYGDLGQGEGWYTCADDESFPYTPCILLILQKSTGETAIIGVNGEETTSPKQYFSVNGTRLSAPQKGVNIVKMSDGKIKKVLVK